MVVPGALLCTRSCSVVLTAMLAELRSISWVDAYLFSGTSGIESGGKPARAVVVDFEA